MNLDNGRESRQSLLQSSNSTRSRTTGSLLQVAEEAARVLREKAGLNSTERFEPVLHMNSLQFITVSPGDIPSTQKADVDVILKTDTNSWWAMSDELPNGKLLILLNPNQTDERARVTIMEEIAHRFFGHAPARFVEIAGVGRVRIFDKALEEEAYWTGTAALLPAKVVAQAVWRGMPIPELARRYGVSRELAEFRVATMKLSQASVKSLN